MKLDKVLHFSESPFSQLKNQNNIVGFACYMMVMMFKHECNEHKNSSVKGHSHGVLVTKNSLAIEQFVTLYSKLNAGSSGWFGMQ